MAGGAAASGGSGGNPWLINESEETRGLTFGEIKQQQQKIIEGNYSEHALSDFQNHLGNSLA